MLYLVSRTYDEDGILEEEIEFELGKYDTVDNMLSHLRKMNDSKSAQGVDKHFCEVLTHIRDWALECYASVTYKQVSNLKEETHDARVRAQGGI